MHLSQTRTSGALSSAVRAILPWLHLSQKISPQFLQALSFGICNQLPRLWSIIIGFQQSHQFFRAPKDPIKRQLRWPSFLAFSRFFYSQFIWKVRADNFYAKWIRKAPHSINLPLTKHAVKYCHCVSPGVESAHLTGEHLIDSKLHSDNTAVVSLVGAMRIPAALLPRIEGK